MHGRFYRCQSTSGSWFPPSGRRSAVSAARCLSWSTGDCVGQPGSNQSSLAYVRSVPRGKGRSGFELEALLGQAAQRRRCATPAEPRSPRATLCRGLLRAMGVALLEAVRLDVVANSVDPESSQCCSPPTLYQRIGSAACGRYRIEVRTRLPASRARLRSQRRGT